MISVLMSERDLSIFFNNLFAFFITASSVVRFSWTAFWTLPPSARRISEQFS